MLGLGVLLSGVAWAFLVRAAIDFGRAARDGRGAAWAVCGAATLGATACLLLLFVLVARIGRALGVGQRERYEPRRSSGGRRVK